MIVLQQKGKKRPKIILNFFEVQCMAFLVWNNGMDWRLRLFEFVGCSLVLRQVFVGLMYFGGDGLGISPKA